LAALALPDGPKAAIHTGERYHLSGTTQLLLRDATCLSILQSRDAALPLLEELAAFTARPELCIAKARSPDYAFMPHSLLKAKWWS